ncbi:MAG: tetratricopeptide repeat protein [Nitrosomonas sp.]|nr:tetratricopeptide repeat protein [Nitrosomonas sp.]
MTSSLSQLQNIFIAQHVFTDREIPKESFISAVHEPQSRDQYRILNFYGIGGQGKTALCEQYVLALAHEQEQNNQLGWAKLDFEVTAHRSIANALLEIRLQLAKQCNIPFPAFDIAFARYFSFTQPGHPLQVTHPELFEQPSSILQDIEIISSDLVDEMPGVDFLYKYGKKFSAENYNWWRRRGRDVLRGLDMLDQNKLLTALPTYLGADLSDWLFDKESGQVQQNRRLVILCDSYEALWRDQPTKTEVEAIHVDAWVRRLVEKTQGVLFVLLGRDKLNWAEIDADWAENIESHLLSGLSQSDADKFLQQVPIVEEDVRNAITEAVENSPFFLDLQVDLYDSLKKQNIQPNANNFGGNHQEILAYFTDHLDESIRCALQVVAHARFVDETLVSQLAEKFLGGETSINFKQLTDYSFWRQEDETWYLHALMRDYLQDRQHNDETALFGVIHQYLFELYDNKLTSLGQATDITETHKQALMEASYHLQQLDAKKFPAWACTRGEVFHKAYAWEQLVPLWEKALGVAESLLGATSLDTALIQNSLAGLYRVQGKYAEAEPLYQRSLTISEDKLGENHLDVAVALNNLAGLYRAQGKYTEAEPLYQRSLMISEDKLGENHPDVATALNNLAGLYQAQGKYAEAEPLYQRSLTICEDKPRAGQSDVTTALGKLVLGEDYLHVAAALNNLAGLYRAHGKYAEAELLYQRSLKIWEDKLGAMHQHVAIALNNLAGLYRVLGKYAEADPLYQRAIVIMEKTFPDGHPKLDTFYANYAALKSIYINEQVSG